MVDVKKYLETSGGNWLRAAHVNAGDRLDIVGEGELDTTTFDKPYINIPTVLVRTGETYTVRLGTKNVGRIAETLGGDTAKWVGNQLEVISIETYSGLGQKGILFKGAKKARQEKISNPVDIGFVEPAEKPPQEPSLGTVMVIRQANVLISEGIPMSNSDWSRYVKPETQRELLGLGLVVEQDGEFRFTEKAKRFLEG